MLMFKAWPPISKLISFTQVFKNHLIAPVMHLLFERGWDAWNRCVWLCLRVLQKTLTILRVSTFFCLGGGGVGGRCCLKIRDVCVDFEPCFKVLKASNLVTNLSVIVHVVVSVYRLVKIWNSCQSLRDSEMTNFVAQVKVFSCSDHMLGEKAQARYIILIVKFRSSSVAFQ